MIIALDYDNCTTLDIPFWLSFIESAKAAGHTVLIVTYRADWHPLETKFDVPVYYTASKAKRDYMSEKGITVNVWIDDRPECVLGSGL